MSLQDLYDDLAKIAYSQGPLEPESVASAAALLDLPRYRASSQADARRLLVADIAEVVDRMTDVFSGDLERAARLYFRVGISTLQNLRHDPATLERAAISTRRSELHSPSTPGDRWLNRAVYLSVVSELLRLGRSAEVTNPPDVRHPHLPDRPKAFISCSASSDFSGEREFFTDLLASCDFEPVLLDKREAQTRPDDIAAALRDSSVLIALIFESPGAYILNEIGAAHALGLPLGVVISDRIQLGGIAPHVTDYVSFAPQAYAAAAPAAVTLFRGLHARVTPTVELPPQIVRSHVAVRITVDADKIATETEIHLLTLAERLSAVNHGLVAYSESERHALDRRTFTVECLTPGIAAQSIEHSDGGTYSATVTFEPELRRGQDVRYVYRQTSTNFWPPPPPGSSDVAYSKAYTISTPTDLVDISLTFPRGYPLQNEDVIATYYKASVDLADETRRARAHFARKTFGGAHTLSLALPLPKLFTSYFIRWEAHA